MPIVDESTTPVRFVVRQTKRDMRIEWHVPDVRGIDDYLYWALNWDAKYEMRLTILKHIPTAQLIVKSGCAGEYPAHMYWDPMAGCMVREGQFSTIHYLVHHGLDGLPTKFLLALARDVPLFDVLPPSGGLFRLTLDEWNAHYDNHSKDIGRLAIVLR